jgi:hypothetical protein
MNYSDYEVNCFIFAIRYAAGRNTGAALMVSTAILSNWSRFTEQGKQNLKDEAQEALYNREDWQKLINKEF